MNEPPTAQLPRSVAFLGARRRPTRPLAGVAAVHRLPATVQAAVATPAPDAGEAPRYVEVPAADLARLDALSADTRTALAVVTLITDAEAVLDRVRHVTNPDDQATMAGHLADALALVASQARQLLPGSPASDGADR